jgi:hypothetical protein
LSSFDPVSIFPNIVDKMSDDDAEEYSGEEDNIEMDGTGEDQEWMRKAVRKRKQWL